ncbi:MAG: efflux RND transporter periplasmic adaptor subunit [Anaerolineae bacterium]|nr:efflux RND transporter periplasmic adaptor subunit [Anaerolineae bacterium]
MKKIVTWLVILSVIAGIIAGGLWLRQRNRAVAQAVDILRSEEITRGNLVITIPASGSIVSNQRSDLFFNMPGFVKYVNVQVGDQVKAGQTLAGIDERELQRAVKLAEIALEQAELNLEILVGESSESEVELAEIAIQDAQQALHVTNLNKALASAQAALSNRMARETRDDIRQAYLDFQKTLEKYNLPYVLGAGITAANMEAEGNVGITALKGNFNIQQAESSRLAAFTALQQAKKSLDDLSSEADPDRIKQAELQIQQAQLNLEQAIQRLDNTVIIAPYDGTISHVNMTAGLLAPTEGPGRKPALSILDNHTFYTDVTVDEIDISKIGKGQQTDIILDAYPNTPLNGTVYAIEDVPDNTSGIVSYRVRISLEDYQTTQPHDGMTASVYIKTQTIEDTLLIPNWAIRTDQTTSEIYTYCLCLVNGEPQQTIIETGLRNDTYTQVLTGLEEGATVVLVAEKQNLFEFDGPPSFGN